MNNKLILAIIILVLIIGGVWYYQNSKPAPATGEPIKIGAALGLSGDCAEFGEGERDALKLGVKEINERGGVSGQPIELIIEDTQCTNRTTVNAIQKLISVNRVVAIIGPTWGDSFQSGYPIINNAKVPAISPSAALEALEIQKTPNDYVFSTWIQQREEVAALQKYAADNNIKTFSVIHDQDPFGSLLAKLFNDTASLSGLQILNIQETPVGAEDFRTQILKIKSLNPQAIFGSFLGPDSKVKFIKQARDLGFKGVVFSSADIQNIGLLETAGPYLEGVIYTYPVNTGSFDSFVSKYKKEYDREPLGPSAGQSYDALNILAEAFKTSTSSGESIRDALLKVSMPGVIVETVNFNDRHQISGGRFEIKTIKDGQFVKLEE